MDLVDAQIDVMGLVRSRAAFDAIETRINEIPGLADPERAALWLCAWSRQGRTWQLKTADQLLQWIGDQTTLPALGVKADGSTARGLPPA